MSLTPIFDATLADAPVNIWQASNIFPKPEIITRVNDAIEKLAKATKPSTPTITFWPQTDYKDWSHIHGYPRFAIPFDATKITGNVA